MNETSSVVEADPFAPKVFDDALPPSLLAALISAAGEMPHRTVSFWTDLRATEPPLIAAVFSHLRALVDLPGLDADEAGVEWWVRRAPAYHFQSWHVDKDEALFMSEQVVRCPAAATILYLGDAGGPTIVSSQVCAQDGSRLVPRRLERAWTVEPHLNRFVVCRGDAAHAVLPSRDHGQRVRTSMPINWWPSPTARNARLGAEVTDHPAVVERMVREPPPEASAWSPTRVAPRRWHASELPRPIEQRWPTWSPAPPA
ncbi:hypothetical protein [Nonomuraea sp. NPDC050643]|uniref:hypothetical protein n=1 Tax=Nonomuraea sp. NPDC050643 TaxID=3155660 RepID=UPI0033D872DE